MSSQRAGVIGLGAIGNRHADCYSEDKGAELVCVCDINHERADAAAKRLGVPAFYSVFRPKVATALLTVDQMEAIHRQKEAERRKGMRDDNE